MRPGKLRARPAFLRRKSKSDGQPGYGMTGKLLWRKTTNHNPKTTTKCAAIWKLQEGK
jgi:hypothetical protein